MSFTSAAELGGWIADSAMQLRTKLVQKSLVIQNFQHRLQLKFVSFWRVALSRAGLLSGSNSIP